MCRCNLEKTLFLICCVFWNTVFSMETSQGEQFKKGTLAATEELLELIVKANAFPSDWKQVMKLAEKVTEEKNKHQNIIQKNKQDVEDLKEVDEVDKNLLNYAIQKLTPNQQDALNHKKVKEVKKLKLSDHNMNGFKTKKGNLKLNSKIDNKRLKNDKTFGLVTKNEKSAGNKFLINKRPHAYLAISIIAEKPLTENELILDRELKYLKQWSKRSKFSN